MHTERQKEYRKLKDKFSPDDLQKNCEEFHDGISCTKGKRIKRCKWDPIYKQCSPVRVADYNYALKEPDLTHKQWVTSPNYKHNRRLSPTWSPPRKKTSPKGSPRKSPGKTSPRKRASDTWSCSKCTYLNKRYSQECAMCKTKPSKKKRLNKGR